MNNMQYIFPWIVIIIGLYFVFFTFLGMLQSASNREFEIANGCIYKSYLSIYNPAFKFGCELARDRTK